MRRLFSVAGFMTSLLAWQSVSTSALNEFSLLTIAWGTPIFILPLVLLARDLLDRHPTPIRAARISAGLHFVMMTLLGSAIISSARFNATHPVQLHLPAFLVNMMLYVSGAFVLLTVINLAVLGLGAPFAISLSKRLATDWLYARTRNPMVLGMFVFLLCLGLRLQSPVFLLWVIVLLLPVMITYLKVFEERELEIRFGEQYVEYREQTPLLIPCAMRRRLPSPVNYEHDQEAEAGRVHDLVRR